MKYKSIEAIYDNGNIELLTKKISKVKSKIKIIFEKNIKTCQDNFNLDRKRPDFKKLKVYGIWKNRADIKSGIDYVNNLRERINNKIEI